MLNSRSVEFFLLLFLFLGPVRNVHARVVLAVTHRTRLANRTEPGDLCTFCRSLRIRFGRGEAGVGGGRL